MTPPQGSFPRPPKPKPASPAERGAEFAEAQRRLKEEAAERRAAAPDPIANTRAGRRSTSGKAGGR
jgi:hypothetical protein